MDALTDGERDSKPVCDKTPETDVDALNVEETDDECEVEGEGDDRDDTLPLAVSLAAGVEDVHAETEGDVDEHEEGEVEWLGEVLLDAERDAAADDDSFSVADVDPLYDGLGEDEREKFPLRDGRALVEGGELAVPHALTVDERVGLRETLGVAVRRGESEADAHVDGVAVTAPERVRVGESESDAVPLVQPDKVARAAVALTVIVREGVAVATATDGDTLVQAVGECEGGSERNAVKLTLGQPLFEGDVVLERLGVGDALSCGERDNDGETDGERETSGVPVALTEYEGVVEGIIDMREVVDAAAENVGDAVKVPRSGDGLALMEKDGDGDTLGERVEERDADGLLLGPPEVDAAVETDGEGEDGGLSVELRDGSTVADARALTVAAEAVAPPDAVAITVAVPKSVAETVPVTVAVGYGDSDAQLVAIADCEADTDSNELGDNRAD